LNADILIVRLLLKLMTTVMPTYCGALKVCELEFILAGL